MWGVGPDLYIGMIIGAVIVIIAFLIIILWFAYSDRE